MERKFLALLHVVVVVAERIGEAQNLGVLLLEQPVELFEFLGQPLIEVDDLLALLLHGPVALLQLRNLAVQRVA